MKCPYCGFENTGDHCRKCSAVIPVEKPVEEPKEELITLKRKRKEMNENGT